MEIDYNDKFEEEEEEDEYYDDDSDSSSDFGGGQQRAFDLGDLEDDDNGSSINFDEEPLTGEEYLRRVRYAAKRCPKVAVADIDLTKLPLHQRRPSTNYFTPPPKLATCLPELIPSEEWEKQFLDGFSLHRQRLQYTLSRPPQSSIQQPTLKLPHQNDKRSWYIYCFGNQQQQQQQNNNTNNTATTTNSNTTTTTTTTNIIQGNQPNLQLLLNIDHVLTLQLIEYHVEWFETRELSMERYVWFYTLLAILEKPIDADTGASLRSLLRRLAFIRSKISQKEDPILPTINILITIVAKYFNQLEPM